LWGKEWGEGREGRGKIGHRKGRKEGGDEKAETEGGDM